MLYLDINEEKTLAFEVEINGVGCDEMSGHVRFAYEDVEYGFPALIEEGKITAIIKPLKELFPNIKNGTVVGAKLELNTETYYFVPWEGEIKVQAPVSVEAKIVDNGKVKETRGIKAKVISEEKAIEPEKKTERPPKKTITERRVDKKGWTKEKIKNITEEDIFEYMKRAGCKNKTIQEIVLNEATSAAAEQGETGTVAVLKYVVKALKKPK